MPRFLNLFCRLRTVTDKEGNRVVWDRCEAKEKRVGCFQFVKTHGRRRNMAPPRGKGKKKADIYDCMFFWSV